MLELIDVLDDIDAEAENLLLHIQDHHSTDAAGALDWLQDFIERRRATEGEVAEERGGLSSLFGRIDYAQQAALDLQNSLLYFVSTMERFKASVSVSEGSGRTGGL